jgi:hypothetical protein
VKRSAFASAVLVLLAVSAGAGSPWMAWDLGLGAGGVTPAAQPLPPPPPPPEPEPELEPEWAGDSGPVDDELLEAEPPPPSIVIYCPECRSCTTDADCPGSMYCRNGRCRDCAFGSPCCPPCPAGSDCVDGHCEDCAETRDACCGNPDPCCRDPVCCGNYCCQHPCECDPCLCDPCSCLNCNDGNACTTDGCSGGNCSHQQITCDDGNPCTDDSCDPGSGCVFTPRDCDDNDLCTDDSCDPNTGECVFSHEPDRDGDGVRDDCDNCPDDYNADQDDSDSDGVGDACDNCPGDYNADQADSDHDGTGDACECEEQRSVGGFCVKAVKFAGAGEVQLKRRDANWSNDFYDDECSTVITEPVWNDPNCTGSPVKNEPICFKQGSKPQLTVTLRTDCQKRPIVVRAINTNWSIEWRASVNVSDPTLIVQLGVPIENGALPGQVLVENGFGLSWSVSENGGQSFTGIGQTTHTLFIAFAEASGQRTAKRMEWVCRTSVGATTGVECARKMHRALDPNDCFDLDHQDWQNPWRVLDGVKSDCKTLSYLLKSAIGHQGLSGADVTYVYGSTDMDFVSMSPDAQQWRSHGDHGNETIWVDNGGWNRFEACCVYGGVWFLGGVLADKTSGLDVLHAFAGPRCERQRQHWRWVDGQGNRHECGDPIPVPPLTPPCP